MKEGIRESDADDIEYYYSGLKRGKYEMRTSKGMFVCPFCERDDVRDYSHKELIHHASEYANHSKKSKHLALLRFAEKYLSEKPQDCNGGEANEKHPIEKLRDGEPKGNEKHPIEKLRDGEPKGNEKHLIEKPRNEEPNAHEKFVWPWKAIVATLPEYREGRHVGESGSRLRDYLTRQGFCPTKVVPLWNWRGFSGIYVVHFRKDWTGFSNAMMLERKFEGEGRGKREWYRGRPRKDGYYGWVARADEYNDRGLIGEHMQRNGDLKAIFEIEKEEERKGTQLVSGIKDEIEEKNMKFKEVESKLHVTESSIAEVVKEKDQMHKNFNEELAKLELRTQGQLQKIISSQDNAKFQLEAQRRELVRREKELDRREALKEDELNKLNHEKRMVEKAVLEQKKLNDNLLALAEEHQKKKEELNKKIIDLEKKLDAKDALVLQIERLKGAMQVMKHMSGEGDLESKKKMEEIEKELQGKEEELDDLEAMNQTLIVKQRRTNDELQDARKELISNVEDLISSRSNAPDIGVKRMGDLDIQPFVIASKKKYPASEANTKAVESCSHWEKFIKDPEWHPFRIIHQGENAKEIINEKDEKLMELKDVYGEEVYHAVVKALLEVNEYNPSGRYPVPELWNFKEAKRAKLPEVIEKVVSKWRLLRRKK